MIFNSLFEGIHKKSCQIFREKHPKTPDPFFLKTNRNATFFPVAVAVGFTTPRAARGPCTPWAVHPSPQWPCG